MTDPITHITRAGEGVFERRGWCVARALDGVTLTAQHSDGVTRFIEHESETRLVRRVVTLSIGVTPVGVTLAGDVFFRANEDVHVWRRATDTLARICRVPIPGWGVPECVVSADGTHLAHRAVTSTAVAIVRVGDGAPVSVVPSPLADARFALGNGGRWLLFTKDVSVQSGSGWTDYVIDRSPTSKRALTGSLPGDDACASVSADGDHVETERRVTERFNPDELP